MAHIHELYDFTVSAFVMHPASPKLLLISHKKLGVWLQPGGHVELNEDPLMALHHELEEETGLKPTDYDILEPAEQPRPTGKISVLPLPFYFNVHDYNDTHKHIDISYLVRSKTADLTDNPDGANAIGWFDIAQIRRLTKKGELFDETLQVCEWIASKKF